jgi:hypothetical protein
VLLLLRQRRGAAGNGLGTITNLRRTSSGDTITYLYGAAGIDLGTTIKQAPAAHNEHRRRQ